MNSKTQRERKKGAKTTPPVNYPSCSHLTPKAMVMGREWDGVHLRGEKKKKKRKIEIKN